MQTVFNARSSSSRASLSWNVRHTMVMPISQVGQSKQRPRHSHSETTKDSSASRLHVREQHNSQGGLTTALPFCIPQIASGLSGEMAITWVMSSLLALLIAPLPLHVAPKSFPSSLRYSICLSCTAITAVRPTLACSEAVTSASEAHPQRGSTRSQMQDTSM